MAIESWLALKYGILAQQADAESVRAAASARLDDARARLLPSQTAAQNYATQAQGYRDIQAGQTAVPVSESAIAENQARSNLLSTQSALLRESEKKYSPEFYRLQNEAALKALGGTSDQSIGAVAARAATYNLLSEEEKRRLSEGIEFRDSRVTRDPNIGKTYTGYNLGTARVPGPSGMQADVVPAMLTPGEAVLNQGAADHVGRDFIDFINQLGAQKMGMPYTGESPKKQQTSKSSERSKSDASSNKGAMAFADAVLGLLARGMTAPST